MNTSESPDFIVSELLSELKESNIRKDKQIETLHKNIKHLILSFVLSILTLVCAFLLYLNQYDYSSYTTQTAEGLYAIIDSNGNVVGQDITTEQLETILRSNSNG